MITMKIKKILRKILTNQKNVKFEELLIILSYFDFKCDRINGSHHIFKKVGITELINIQNVNGEVKPYQVKQFLSLIDKYGLINDEDSK